MFWCHPSGGCNWTEFSSIHRDCRKGASLLKFPVCVSLSVQLAMGSAMGAAFSQADSSAETSIFQALCSPLLSCRKARDFQKKKPVSWYPDDVWIGIMNLLDAKSLLRFAVTNRRFCALAKDDSVWKAVCFREIGLPAIHIRPAFGWRNLYMSAVDGSHSFSHRQSEKHIDWMRLGMFCIDSGEAIATDKLKDLQMHKDKESLPVSEDISKIYGVSNVQKGVWIADLHLVRCPVCNLAGCEGTMQALDARHWELFLQKEYKDCEWSFEQVSARNIAGHCIEAAACVFDAKQFRRKETQGLLDFKTWAAPSGSWQPKGQTSCFGAASCTNLQPNQGLEVKVHIMKGGVEGPVVAIRICHQLV